MRTIALLAALAALFSFAVAAEAAPKVDTVVDNLDNPAGVAVQPETGHVFVSDSGAGRVVRIVDGKIEDVITGYPLDVYGKGPKYNIGPLGLTFLDKNTLAVGDGGFKDGEEYIRVFTVPEPGKPAIKFDETKALVGPLAGSDDMKPEGNLYAVAASKAGIFVTCNGDDTKGWVAKAEANGEKFGELKRFIATKEATQVDAPVGITISPRGEVVIGQMGEITVPKDSLLTFYNANSGKLLLNLETGLFDITGLAYSPQGQLYATDFAWMASKEGGLFQLIATTKDGKQGVRAVKVVELDKPTALAFGPDGSLYITVIGTAEESSEKKPGKLLRIAPGL